MKHLLLRIALFFEALRESIFETKELHRYLQRKTSGASSQAGPWHDGEAQVTGRRHPRTSWIACAEQVGVNGPVPRDVEQRESWQQLAICDAVGAASFKAITLKKIMCLLIYGRAMPKLFGSKE